MNYIAAQHLAYYAVDVSAITPYRLMFTPQPPVQDLFDDIKEYVITQRKLLLTVASKKGVDVLYIMIVSTIFITLLLFFLIMLSFAAAFGLGAWLDSLFLGFLIVAFFYVLLGGLVWILKDRLIKTVLLKLFINSLAANAPSEHE